MTTYDPAHLRSAAQFLDGQDLYNAATVLRTKADALQKQKLEDDHHLKIGQHFRALMEKSPSRWKFTMTADDLRIFGKAAKEAVDAHRPKSSFAVGGGGGSAAAARSPYPPTC